MALRLRSACALLLHDHERNEHEDKITRPDGAAALHSQQQAADLQRQRGAESVKSYLLNQGVSFSRLTHQSLRQQTIALLLDHRVALAGP